MRCRISAIAAVLALTGCATPAGETPGSNPVAASEPVAARWEPYVLHFRETPLACQGGARCTSREREVAFILEHLGAREIAVSKEQATFTRLVPVTGNAPAPSNATPVAAQWETVRFRRQVKGRYDDGIEYFFSHIEPRVLPSFTARNLREQTSQLTVEVLLRATD